MASGVDGGREVLCSAASDPSETRYLGLLAPEQICTSRSSVLEGEQKQTRHTRETALVLVCLVFFFWPRYLCSSTRASYPYNNLAFSRLDLFSFSSPSFETPR